MEGLGWKSPLVDSGVVGVGWAVPTFDKSNQQYSVGTAHPTIRNFPNVRVKLIIDNRVDLVHCILRNVSNLGFEI